MFDSLVGKSCSHPDGGEVIGKRKGVTVRWGLKESWRRISGSRIMI
jgi:hypothetical protein